MTATAAGRASRRGRSTWLVPGLDALIEGAAIAVADAALASVAGYAPLGPFPFAIVAAASLYLVRHAADRTTTLIGLGVLYVGAFVAGGLLGGSLSSAVAAPAGTGHAVGFAQGAAVFAALAVFRGSRHVDPVEDDLVVGSLLQWGFPLLALPWLYAAQLQADQRAVFAATAFPATLLFAAAGLLALGLARLDSLASLSGVNWRTNRAWFVLLFAVLAAMVVIALPVAFLLGTPITQLAAGLMGPLSFILGPIGAIFTKILEFLFFLLTPLIDFIQSLIHPRTQDQQPTPIGDSGPLFPPAVDQGEPSTAGLVILAAIAIVIGLVIFAVILRLTYRRRPPREDSPDAPLEEREFRLPSLDLHVPRFGLPHRRIRPTTATAAYLAFLGDLDGAPDLARRPEEPPATHAARLRQSGFSDPRAGLLAADYALERYALRDVSPNETTRALQRQVRLRDLLHARRRVRAGAGDDKKAPE